MRKLILLLFIFSTFYLQLEAQVGIGTGTPNSSANLELNVTSSTSKKGMLLPRVPLLNNTDVTTIAAPAVGLIVYNTTANGTGNNAVEANTFYYWDGVQWTNLSNLTEVRRELLPQVFFIAETNPPPPVPPTATTPQNTNSGTDNINTKPVVVKFNQSNVVLNTGNNITLKDDNTFLINNSGSYEVSGFINYNPSIRDLNSTTNVEFIIEVSTNNGSNWSSIAKTVGVWGAATTLNNRTNNIPPVIITAQKNELIRCLVSKTQGVDHSTSAAISAPTGLRYGKVLKIQKLD